MVVKRGWPGAAAAASAVGFALVLSGCGGGDGTISVAPPSSHASSSASAATPSSSSSTASAATDSGSIPSAVSLIHTARATDAKATSAHMNMSVTATDGSKQVVDIRGTVNGSNQQVSTQQTGEGTATIRTVSGDNYVRGDKTFWQKQVKMSAAQAAVVQGRWIVVPQSSANTLDLPTIDQLLDATLGAGTISDSDLSAATVARGTLDGEAVYVIHANDGSGDTITVSADGKATPLRMAGTTDDGKLNVTLDGWNTQAPITAPSGAINQPTV